MRTETWYSWKEYVVVEGESKPRLLTPWSDPNLHEFPFDFLFTSVGEAVDMREEYDATDEDWVLCKVTYEPLAIQPTQP